MDAAAVQAVRYHERTGERPLVLHTDGVGTPVRTPTLRGMMERGLVEYIDQGRDHTGARRGVHVLTAKGIQRAYYVRTDTPPAEPEVSDSAAPSGEPLAGRVIAHQGQGRGVQPDHAQDPIALAAAQSLAQAGLELADLPTEYDPQTSTATGYMVESRGMDEDGDSWIYVFYLTSGKTHDPATDRHPRAALRKAVDALREDGWAVEPFPAACVRAHTTQRVEPVRQHDRTAVMDIVDRVEGPGA